MTHFDLLMAQLNSMSLEDLTELLAQAQTEKLMRLITDKPVDK